MAKFNPDVPNQEAPSYFGLSRPIDQFEGDKSLGVALKGIGDTLENAFKGADLTVKSLIDDAIYKKVDYERESTTGALEQMAGIPQQDRVADYTADLPTKILPTGDTPVPAAVEGVEGEASTYTNAGKASPALKTYYSGRLDMIAKDLRAQYPGYRDYIDRKIEHVTGENPANSVMRHLMELVNQQQAGSGSALKKAEAEVFKRPGYPNAPAVLEAIRSGRVGDPLLYVMKAFHEEDARAYRQKAAADDFAAGQRNATLEKDYSGNEISNITRDVATSRFGTVMGNMGFSAQSTRDFIEGVRNGTIQPPSDQDAVKLVHGIDAMIEAATEEAWQKSNIPLKNSRGQTTSYASTFGETETRTKIKGQLDTYYRLRDAVANKDWGFAFYHGNNTEAVQRDSRNSIFNDINVGHAMQIADAVQHFGGPTMMQLFTQQQLQGDLIKRIAKSQQYVDWQKSMMIDPNRDPTQPYTLKDAITDANKRGVGVQNPNNPRMNVKAENEIYDNLVKFPGSVLLNKNVPDNVKKLAVRSAFSGRNDQMISLFFEQGNGTDSSQRAYRLMTDPRMVKELQRLGPEEFAMGMNWTDKTFVNEVAPAEIKDLGKIQTTPGFTVIYNPDTNHFSSVYQRPAGAGPFAPNVGAYQSYVDKSLSRLNAGIDGMKGYIQANGGDVSAYVLKTLISRGLDPKTAVGIPGDMIKSLIASGQSKDTFGTKVKNKNQDRVE